jgi:hypothetical protein
MGEGERKAQMSLVDLDHALLDDMPAVSDTVEDATGSNEVATIAGLQALLHERGHTIDSLRTDLENEVAAHIKARAAVEAAKQSHAADVAVITSWLQNEAQERDWCDEYDDCVEAVNHKLTIKLPSRKRDYTVTMRVSYVLTRNVHVASADEAWDYVTEDWDTIHDNVSDASIDKVEKVSVEVDED